MSLLLYHYGLTIINCWKCPDLVREEGGAGEEMRGGPKGQRLKKTEKNVFCAWPLASSRKLLVDVLMIVLEEKGRLMPPWMKPRLRGAPRMFSPVVASHHETAEQPGKDNAIDPRAEGAQGGWGQEDVIIVPILQTRQMRHRDDCDQLTPMLLVSGSTESRIPSVFGQSPPLRHHTPLYRHSNDRVLVRLHWTERFLKSGTVWCLRCPPCWVSAVPTSMAQSGCISCHLDLTEGKESKEVPPEYQGMRNH